MHDAAHTAHEYRALGKNESAANGACAKEDVHDEHGDAAANQTRHDQETNRVYAHGGKCIDFVVDHHAPDVSRKRRTASACNQECSKDRAKFTDDHHHDHVAHKVGETHFTHHRNHFDNGDSSEQGGNDKKNRENFDGRKIRLHDDVTGVGLQATVFGEDARNGSAEQSDLLAERTAQQEQAQQMECLCGGCESLPVSRAPYSHSSVRSLPKFGATSRRVRIS